MKRPNIETLQQRRAELDRQIQQYSAREREASRKRETRAKIIVGGIVLAAAQREPGLRKWLAEKIAALPREADRTLFSFEPTMENANVA